MPPSRTEIPVMLTGEELETLRRWVTRPWAPRGLAARLSPREQEVLALLSEGKSNKKIASALGVSETTVKHHLRSTLEKLHLENRVQAAIYAVRHGLGTPPSE